MLKNIIRFFEMLFGISILCAGAAMGIISRLGQTTSTGTCSAISAATGMKVGTAMALLYSIFVFLQVLILRKQFRFSRFFQLIPAVLQGVILNYFKYYFPPFQSLYPETYVQRFLVFGIGMVLISVGFTMVKCSNFVNYPPESFCTIVSERIGIRFGTCKIVLDFIYVTTTLLLCWKFNLSFDIVREGTLIFALCNGMLINLFMPHIEKLFSAIDNRVSLKV